VGCCDHLPQFTQVNALYTLNTSNAHLLVEAKGYNSAPARMILQQMLLFPLYQHVLQWVSEHFVTHVILASIRRQRALQGLWHPILLWEQVVEGLKTHRGSGQPKVVHFFHQGTKQALLAKDKRKLMPHFKTDDTVRLRKQMIEDLLKCPDDKKPCVLFLDDILTTGQTALGVYRAVEEVFRQTRAEAHLCTIFRSPMGMETL